ncbi:DNA (cytosine-5-)-methyltransferase, partial [bacterium]|nr:DNA (cytosine-5-)-methyltransferase [bacterium]
IDYKVLNAKDHGGIPQNRERIFIVGFKHKKHYDRFKKLDTFKNKNISKQVVDLLENAEDIDNKYYYNDKPLFPRIKDDITESGVVYQWRRRYVRQNKNGVCPTLTANMGTGGHNVPIIRDKLGIRKLTPRECARIQGYRDTFKLPLGLIADSQIYKQLGNSVPVPLVQRIATEMLKALT